MTCSAMDPKYLHTAMQACRGAKFVDIYPLRQRRGSRTSSPEGFRRARPTWSWRRFIVVIDARVQGARKDHGRTEFRSGCVMTEINTQHIRGPDSGKALWPGSGYLNAVEVGNSTARQITAPIRRRHRYMEYIWPSTRLRDPWLRRSRLTEHDRTGIPGRAREAS